ncbi:16S rRNA (guanine(527)-N(7))-methyltransferase RsmG [Propionivibrio dicarboxylicus]|uniref:Ribosomal RNA small subunit methyltransferase G n=1 Tax=Propionivibrio dicarboxylicus TaxID=83767 RepID=A0A1G7WF75_9RHOO|nr:16S rRNA (guanine(527)-N(7))-methyltransferase RsmG [Propionivibrio dicarboxylicus]SDG70606.1 16S rRNA (guanine527-N7)-methyltransferase [Propionivibrio dicarboxylicus]
MSQAEQLSAGLAAMGLELDVATQERLLAYLALLYKWNRTYSLTALREQDRAVSHHLLDSLAILPFVPAGRLLDVGSGGGTPGIPLAIARPDLSVTLLDSNTKKAAFLQQAAIELGLRNISVHAGRVEQYHPESGFTAITSRAFAELADFVTLSAHLLVEGGVWLAMKGVHPQAELDRLPATAQVGAVHRLDVPGVDGDRHLVVLSKAAH